jgi:magnesium transporter
MKMEAEKRIASKFLSLHPADAARLCETLPPVEIGTLFGEIPVATALPVLRHLTPAVVADFLPMLPDDRGGSLLAQLPPDFAAGILRRMSEQERAVTLASMPEKTSSALSLILHYPAHTAGAMMDPTVLSLPNDLHVNEARQLTQRSARRILYYLYVVDRDQKLVGVLNLRELYLAGPRDAISTIMHAPVTYLTVRAETATILNHPGWRLWHALPVVDDQGVLVGTVRYETFRRLEREAAPTLQIQDALGVAIGLGELYWATAAQLLRSLGPLVSPEFQRPDRRGGNGTQSNAND